MIEAARSWALLRGLRRGAHGPAAELERSRARLLRASVQNAWERVPFYRSRWGERPEISSLGDLARLPVIGPGEAREAAERGDLLDREADAGSCPTFETSASSGAPLAVPRGPVEQRLWRVGALRIWFEHGYRWSDVTAHVDPQAGPPHPLQRLGISRSAWITSTDPGRQLEELRELGADVVAVTPSVLRRIAERADDDGSGSPRARIVFCQGEVLDDATRGAIARGFGADPVDLYGATEVGYLGWQCELRGDLHLNAELVVVEILGENGPADPGELGRVVVTDLRGRIAPRIRWDTGDLARVPTGPCGCGRTLPTIGRVEGRAREAVSARGARILTQRGIADALSDLAAPHLYRLEPLGEGQGERVRLHLDPLAGGRGEPLRRRLSELRGGLEVELVVEPIADSGLKTPLAWRRRSAVAA